jgi:hypothetical protein
MKRLERMAILLEMMRELKNCGSRCGEAHLQKAAYFLQELLRVPMGLEFVRYKSGPFSFGFRDELAAMQALGLARYVFQDSPYAPSIAPTEQGDKLRSRFPNTLSRYSGPLRFVAGILGGKGFTELKRVATALYVSREPGGTATGEGRAQRVHALEPQVTLDEARSMVEALDAIEAQAAALRTAGQP